ncbi:MAG: hypothetical protein KAV87_19900, partial [Desulfobacteraceae bacterium]|nr:hypothetical protein [Desulfobacteraceae bacterium]
KPKIEILKTSFPSQGETAKEVEALPRDPPRPRLRLEPGPRVGVPLRRTALKCSPQFWFPKLRRSEPRLL